MRELEVMEEEKKQVDTLVIEVQKQWPSYKVSSRSDSFRSLPVDADFQVDDDRDSIERPSHDVSMNLRLVPKVLKADETLNDVDLKRRTKYFTREIEPTDCKVDHNLK